MKLTLEIIIAGLAGVALVSPLGGPIVVAAALVALVIASMIHLILYGIDS